jgi:hypothetical protein
MSYVYLVSAGSDGPVKIGVSNSPFARLKEIQTGNPTSLELAAMWPTFTRSEAFYVERHVLSDAVLFRLQGEWIDADPEFVSTMVRKHLEDALFL